MWNDNPLCVCAPLPARSLPGSKKYHLQRLLPLQPSPRVVNHHWERFGHEAGPLRKGRSLACLLLPHGPLHPGSGRPRQSSGRLAYLPSMLRRCMAANALSCLPGFLTRACDVWSWHYSMYHDVSFFFVIQATQQRPRMGKIGSATSLGTYLHRVDNERKCLLVWLISRFD